MVPRPQHVLFVFVDGIGIGPPDEQNPFSQHPTPALSALCGADSLTAPFRTQSEANRVVRAIDPRLGVPGLPQSGTGQATLFTGVNCAALAGRHFGPFPHSTSRAVIEERNIFARLMRATGWGPDELAFANAYPQRFFDFVKVSRRWTVTTLCCHLAGIRLRGHADVVAGTALPADITGVGWRGLGYAFDPISEYEGGARLVRLAESNRFTLFEYFLTDKAGHGRSPTSAAEVLMALDRFLAGILDALNLETTLLVITSDHGNLEDLSTKSHTLNPVPFVATGPGAQQFAEITTIQDVTPLIESLVRPGS